MVRRYAQPVRVGTVPRDVSDSLAGFEGPPIAGLDGAGGYAAGAPMWFEWGGRRYHVRAVLAQWRERRAWWRDVLDTDDTDDTDDTAPVVHPIGSAAEVPAQPDRSAIAVAARERLVWRVEAGPGWLTRTGVFDLACDEVGPGEPDPSGWVLLRVSD